MSAHAGWYPDPAGVPGLYRYWDGRAWSAATSPNPASPPPAQPLGSTTPESPQPGGSAAGAQTYGAGGAVGGAGTGSGGGTGYGSGSGIPSGGTGYGAGAYADFQQMPAKKSPVGWWIGAAALLLVIVVIAVIAIRAIGGGDTGPLTGPTNAQPSQDACPTQSTALETPASHPADGRVHGGPVSYPQLGSPWGPPTGDNRVPFGRDVLSQNVVIEPNYDGTGASWVASVLVGELQAGDGFFTPEEGSQIVVKCILGTFYADAEVQSDVIVNQAMTIDGNDGWMVESQLSFDIEGLKTKGELLIVAIVTTGATAGLYYASIPDTSPELVPAAREALKNLKVDE